VNFIAEHPLADHARFELLDFNDETLQHVSGKIAEVKNKHHRKTEVKLVKNSVQNLLRSNGKTSTKKNGFDLIYCSGLYDYLSDRVCQALNIYLYDLLHPGGLLVVGNFAPWTPGQNLMEHLMDWFLIYRNGKQLAALAPQQATKDHCAMRAESAGANIFLEVRKPK
jgi:extracellular factor (EF) 3-hydroxypalmitic acid methyl ester biosynthesis protein